MKAQTNYSKRVLLLLVSLAMVALFFVFRFHDSGLHHQRSRHLLNLKLLETELDRDMLRVASFILVQYDPLVESSAQLSDLIDELKDPEGIFYGQTERLIDQDIDDYAIKLEQKFEILERLKLQAAIVRNGIHYLTTAVNSLDTNTVFNSEQLQKLLIKLYYFNLFPSDAYKKQILKEIKQIQSENPQDSVDNILLHINANLSGLALLAELKADYLSIPSTESFVKLQNSVGEFHFTSDVRQDWFNIGTALLAIYLLLILAELLRQLDKSRKIAENSLNRLNDAVESLSEAFALFDKHGQLILCNHRWHNYYPWLNQACVDGLSLQQMQHFNKEYIHSIDYPDPNDTTNYIERLHNDRWYLASDNLTSDGGQVCVRMDITDSKRDDATLRKLSRALKQSPTSVIITNTSGAIEYVNPKFEEVSGYSAAEAVGKKPSILKADEQQVTDYQELWETITAGKEWRGQFHNRRKDGSIYWERAVISPLRDDMGEITHFIAVNEDITAQRRAEEQLRTNATVFDTTSEGILVTDRNNRIKTVNPAFTFITGYTAEEVIGRTPALLSSGRHDYKFYQKMWAKLQKSGFWSGEIWNRRKDGTVYPEWLSLVAIKDEHGEIFEHVAVFTDISQRKRDEAQIHRQSHYDALTGLPNRHLLLDRLQQGILAARHENRLLGLLFIGLDRFKSVNDTLGHVSGDELLQKAAERLQSQIRETDTLARFGGDEFVVLLHELDDVNDAALISEQLITNLSEPFTLSGHEIYIGASIGITLYPTDTQEAETMLRNADMAMTRAKEAGRNRYQYFTLGIQKQVSVQVELERELRQALERDELLLYFEPIIDIKAGKVTKAEALLRWNHPDKGFIEPKIFIPLAEETGLIGPLGLWVIRHACLQCVDWINQGLELTVSVNVSSRQLGSELNASTLETILTETGLPANHLILEITEGLMLEASTKVINWLNGFKRLGVTLSVDDFGTGYSSLGYLKKFPVDILKIDRSFVHELPNNREDVSLVEAILAMGNSLGMKVVAEGVETEEQCRFLCGRNCHYLQGYYFGKAMPGNELAKQVPILNTRTTQSITTCSLTNSE